MKIDELIKGVEYEALLLDGTSSGMRFKLVGECLMYLKPHIGWVESELSYNSVKNLEFAECEFNPECDEEYYFPVFHNANGYDWYRWSDNGVGSKIKKVVGIYKTRDQAIQRAKELGWL